MDSQQTPRTTENLVAERASPTVKESESSPLTSGFRPQAYSVGAAVRPPPPGIVPQNVARFPHHRSEQARPSLGPSSVGAAAAAAAAGAQASNRPPFGPPRPLNLPSFQAPNIRAGPRFHPPAAGPTSGPRPLATDSYGPRPAIFPANQRVRDQPRNGEIRPRVETNAESFGGGGGGSTRPIAPSAAPVSALSQSFHQNSEIRRHPFRAIPETALTPSPRNDRPSLVTREEKTSDRSVGGPGQATRRQRSVDEMQAVGSPSPLLGSAAGSADTRRGTSGGSVGSNDDFERDKDSRASSRSLDEKRPNHDADDDDDDDVVVDEDVDNKSITRKTDSARTDSPAARIDEKSDKKSAVTSGPTPPIQQPERPDSAVTTRDEQLNSLNTEKKSAATSRPTPPIQQPERPDSAVTTRDEQLNSLNTEKKSAVASRPTPPIQQPERPDSAVTTRDEQLNSLNTEKKSAVTSRPTPPIQQPERPDSAVTTRDEQLNSLNTEKKSAVTSGPTPPMQQPERPDSAVTTRDEQLNSLNTEKKSAATSRPTPPIQQPERPDSAVTTRDEQLNSLNTEKKSAVTSRPTPPIQQPERPDSAVTTHDEQLNSLNTEKKSATPSPSRSAEHSDRPTSAMASTEETKLNEKSSSTPVISASPSPRTEVQPEDVPRPLSAADSSVKDGEKSAGLSSRSESRQGGGENSEQSSDLGKNEAIEEVGASRSPVPPSPVPPSPLPTSPLPPSRTPTENPATLSIPPTPTSRSRSVTPNSPIGSVKGFDEGEPRSLSPKSPARSVEGAVADADAVSPTADTAVIGSSSSSLDGIAPPTGGDEKSIDAPPADDRADRTPIESTPVATPQGRKAEVASSAVKRSGDSIKSDVGGNVGSGVADDGTIRAAPTTNGVAVSPTKRASATTKQQQPPPSRDEIKKTSVAGSPVKSPSKSIKSLPRTPEAAVPPSTAEKKIPMNKIQVGAAPSPNLKTVRSKIGSLENASYKPGGGKVKIENRKLDFSKAQPKIAAKNDKYTPSGGDKKITQVKLQWNAKPKVGSLDNATYKPGGGDKKIETVKLDFKDKAKPKVGSKENAKHVPGGGAVKSSSTPPKTPQDPPNDIETQKIDVKAESKIGSLDNVKHKPGGGDKKIFNDKDHQRHQQTGSNVESINGSGAQSPVPSSVIDDRKSNLPASDNNLNES